jgi:hypothetical protein
MSIRIIPYWPYWLLSLITVLVLTFARRHRCR